MSERIVRNESTPKARDIWEGVDRVASRAHRLVNGPDADLRKVIENVVRDAILFASTSAPSRPKMEAAVKQASGDILAVLAPERKP